MADIPIHVAIPSYNNAEGLAKLLPQIVTQHFASVTVMDDGSTDATQEIVTAFDSVRYIRSEQNCGPVAAKNLILQDAPSEGLILFIDSDMGLITQNIPEKLEEFVVSHPKIGGGIGIIRTQYGSVMRFSKGYDLNPVRMVVAGILYKMFRVFRKVPGASFFLKGITKPFTMDLDGEEAKTVDWVAEGFFFVRADLFKKFGGFDTRFTRFHEGPDICLQIRKSGYQIWFCPEIEIQDYNQHSGSSTSRIKHWWISLFKYLLKNPSRLFIYYYPRP